MDKMANFANRGVPFISMVNGIFCFFCIIKRFYGLFIVFTCCFFVPTPAAYTGRRYAFALAALFDALPLGDGYFVAVQIKTLFWESNVMLTEYPSFFILLHHSAASVLSLVVYVTISFFEYPFCVEEYNVTLCPCSAKSSILLIKSLYIAADICVE